MSTIDYSGIRMNTGIAPSDIAGQYSKGLETRNTLQSGEAYRNSLDAQMQQMQKTSKVAEERLAKETEQQDFENIMESLKGKYDAYVKDPQIPQAAIDLEVKRDIDANPILKKKLGESFRIIKGPSGTEISLTKTASKEDAKKYGITSGKEYDFITDSYGRISNIKDSMTAKEKADLSISKQELGLKQQELGIRRKAAGLKAGATMEEDIKAYADYVKTVRDVDGNIPAEQQGIADNYKKSLITKYPKLATKSEKLDPKLVGTLDQDEWKSILAGPKETKQEEKQENLIRVKIKKTGELGKVPASKFNSNLYERLQ